MKKGDYLSKEEMIRRTFNSDYPLAPEEAFYINRARRVGSSWGRHMSAYFKYNSNPMARLSAANDMSDQVQTLGEKRVKVDFNQTGSETVDLIKYGTARLIDHCESMRGDKNTNGGSPEKQRLISLAQTAFEEAAMWSVKANFTK